MIIHKKWKQYATYGQLKYYCEGWFLFGLIPLFVNKYEAS